MDAPALLLVPPSPHPQSPPQPRKQPGRDSSDAIFSIYSMYSDEIQDRASGSWHDAHVHSRSASASTAHRASVASTSKRRPRSAVREDEDDSELAYFASDARHSIVAPPSRTPSTARSHSASRRTASDLFDSAPGSTAMRTSDLSASSYAPAPSLSAAKRRSGSPQTGSRRSSRSSPRRFSATSHELPPLPPSVRSTPSPTPPSQPLSSEVMPLQNHHRPPSDHRPRSQTPTRQPSPSPAPLTPKTSSKLNPKSPLTIFDSPSSIVSLVPSEGEDADGFHVRNTYAQLEATGVKGDGYEEGIERTRARVGTSRISQLQAEEALGDGQEKKRELDAREIQVLQNVDRYGFLSIPSHDRLVLLPTAPFLKKLSPVSAGSPSISPQAATVTSLPPPFISPKESSRIGKWTRMLVPYKRGLGGNVERWEVRSGKEAKLRSRIYKGIPDRWRRAAWDLMLSRIPGVSSQTFEHLASEYRENLERPSPFDIQIDLDVPRTISGHIMFRTRYGAGQRSLFHVLHAFSLRCTPCGYVQGMGPIAATLLCYFEPDRVYGILVLLHDAYKLHTVFDAGFPGMLEAIYVQERVMALMMPAVYAACARHSVATTAYATKWYITLFANSVPFQTQLRLWDAFLFEGYDLFIAMAVAVVWAFRDHITSATANFETILSLLSSFFVPQDEDALMTWIGGMLADKKLRASIVQWRAEWKVLVREGKDAAALL